MKTKLSRLSVLVLLIFFQSCYNEPIGSSISAENTIKVNSELYNDIDRIIENENTSNEGELVCIDFIYTLTLYVFDEDLNLLNSSFIQSDQQFSDFLGSLEATNSISISYPITTTLNNGSTYSISNNQELKEVIDQCKKDDDIADCENLIRNCVWIVGNNENGDNTYLDSIFKEENGSTLLTIDSDLYFGSWSVFFIDDELHININITDNDEIKEYFNYDWKVDYIDENSLKLTNENRILILDQYCDTDNAECNNFNFSECELVDNPNVAEFILDDYNDCLYTLLQVESANTNIIYFETLNDANNNENPITSNQVYLNTSSNQIIQVRIENIEEETYFIIEIVLEAETC